MKKITSFFVGLTLLLSLTVNAFAVGGGGFDDLYSNTADYIYGVTKNPGVGSIGGEWAVLSLARADKGIPNEYFGKYYAETEKYVKSKNGILHDKKYTEYSRMILAVTAIGKDPTNIGGYNLLIPLADYEGVIWQGINGPIWALLALDSKNYEIPKNSNAAVEATRDKYVKYILKNQTDDGGWAISGVSADIDMTAMAIMALSKYRNSESVNSAIEKGIEFLAFNRESDGGFKNSGNVNAESCAQVIIALCEAGVSPNDERFTKNGVSLLEFLGKYSINGGFKHLMSDTAPNQMATEQCFCALVAAKRFLNGENSLYDMTDVKTDLFDIGSGLINKHSDVVKQNITNEYAEFDDIARNSVRNKIIELAKRNIINGKTDMSFEPNGTMTRAEFAAIVTRALGLTKNGGRVFDDVLIGEWYYDYVNTAYSYGIINGVSDTEFNPMGTITREEAAVMIERAARLCGIENEINSEAARDILAPFYDYMTVSEWARLSMAFCYNEGILSDEIETIEPKISVKRDEVAGMIYNMIDISSLL